MKLKGEAKATPRVKSDDLNGLRQIRIDHPKLKERFVVSLEPKARVTEDGIDAIADAAAEVNASVENIGARRLSTVLERVLDDVSFSATDRNGETQVIDAQYVRKAVGELAKNADLSRFIL